VDLHSGLTIEQQCYAQVLSISQLFQQTLILGGQYKRQVGRHLPKSDHPSLKESSFVFVCSIQEINRVLSHFLDFAIVKEFSGPRS
jgi:hypothetical protein